MTDCLSDLQETGGCVKIPFGHPPVFILQGHNGIRHVSTFLVNLQIGHLAVELPCLL